MKDKEKQVEEITKVLLDCGRQFENIDTATADYNYVNRFYHIFKIYAKALVKNNIVQIQEDDVVVPKDEYRYIKDMADHYDPFWFCAFGGCEGACKECKDTCEMSIFVKERKETAEKILNEIMSIETEDETWRKNKSFVCFVNKVLNKCEKLAEQYNVKI